MYARLRARRPVERFRFQRDLLLSRSPREPPLTMFGTQRDGRHSAHAPNIVKDGTSGQRAQARAEGTTILVVSARR